MDGTIVAVVSWRQYEYDDENGHWHDCLLRTPTVGGGPKIGTRGRVIEIRRRVVGAIVPFGRVDGLAI